MYPTAFVSGPTITVDPASPGVTIPDDFIGFSFEHSYITLNKLKTANTNLKLLLQLFNNKLNIRVGGNTADTQIAANFAIDDFCNFVTAVGATVIYGLPGKIISPSVTDADQAAVDAAIALRIHNILGDAIVKYQIGNEPNFYGISYATYASRWQTIHDAVVASVAGAKFYGSDDGCGFLSRISFLPQFMPDKGSQVDHYTFHRYGPSGANSPSTTIQPMIYNLQQLINDWRAYTAMAAINGGKRIRLTEGGCLGGGSNLQDGTCLAASIWNLRVMATVAALGGLGVNFHGTESGTQGYSPCRDRSDGTWNGGSAWSVNTDVFDGNNTYGVTPTFYAMKLFHAFVGGRVIPSKSILADGYTLGVLGADAKTRVLVINTDLQAIVNFEIASTAAFTTADAVILTAPTYESRELTLGGGVISGLNGSSTVGSQSLSIVSSKAQLRLGPGSSAVVTLS